MEVTFLEAKMPLTKEYRLENGTLRSTPYPNARLVTSHHASPNSLRGFLALLVDHAASGHCLMKGNPERPLQWETRVGLFNRADHTDWITLDFDGIDPLNKKAPYTAQESLDALDVLIARVWPTFASASRIVQFSASHGLKPGLRAHVFLRLDRMVPPSLIKLFLTQVNLSTPDYEKDIKLNPAGLSLSYALDICVNDNARVIYIAPPQLNGIENPAPERFHLIEKIDEFAKWPEMPINPQDLQAQVQDKIDALRSTANLPKRKVKAVDKHGAINVVTNPDRAIVTEFREDGDFTHLNLNGGDSWGYWHFTGSPKVLYNFKGEPNYELQALDPDYYGDALERAKNFSPDLPQPGEKDATGRAYLVFRDIESAAYYNGWYDYDTDEVTLYQARSKEQLTDFLAQHGQPQPDFVPDWYLTFDFTSGQVFDPERRRINIFRESEYLRRRPKPVTQVPKTINKLLRHVLADNEDSYNQFINWIAFMVQKRRPPRTAFLLHGTQGTGKDVLFNRILSPIFGKRYCTMKELGDLERDFNAFIAHKILVMINEVRMSDAKRPRSVTNKLKHLITGETITLHKKHQNEVDIANTASFIFCSNEYDPLVLSEDDRRFHVAPRQETKLLLNEEEWEIINRGLELADFTDFLMNYTVDEEKARTPEANEAKKEVQYLSKTSIDIFAESLLAGNLEFFYDCAPHPDEDPFLSPQRMTQAPRYRELLDELFLAVKEKDGKRNLLRNEVQFLFEFAVNKLDKAAIAFEQYVKHHKIVFKKAVRVGERTTSGLSLTWHATPDLIGQWERFRKSTPPSQGPVLRRIK